MFTNNKFANDTTNDRAKRLDYVQQFFPTIVDELPALPDATRQWALNNPYTAYTQGRVLYAMYQGESADLTALMNKQLQTMREEYQVARSIGFDLFRDNEHFRGFGFHLQYPLQHKAQRDRVRGVIAENDMRIAHGETMYLPPHIIERLQNAYDAVMDTKDKRDAKDIEVGHTRAEIAIRWREDTNHLRTLLNWCIAVWGEDDVRLNSLGFARASQLGQRRSTQAPGTVSDIVLFNTTLSWGAAERATSYRVMMSETMKRGSWVMVYSGRNTQCTVSLPAKGGLYFRIYARNAGGNGESTYMAAVISLDTPRNVMYKSGALVWERVPFATGYDVEESNDGIEWTVLLSNEDVERFALSPQKGIRQYRICARYGAMTSPYSPIMTLRNM